MSIIILTKNTKYEYETTSLIKEFNIKDVVVRVCQFKKFDIVINDGIYYDGAKLELPKLVLVRLGAGITRAELAIIRFFELAGVKVVNSSSSINLVQDKFQSSEMLHQAGIAVPSTMIARYPITNNLVEKHIGFPCILKVVVGSFGEGIYMCHSKQEYERVIEFANALHNEKVLIAQEYIDDRPGEDLRVFIVGDKVIGAMKRTAPIGDFRANITNGGTGEEFEVTPEVEKIALDTARVLNLQIAGIDLLFDKRGFRVCEANSNPGFSGFDKYCNTNVAKYIVEYALSLIN